MVHPAANSSATVRATFVIDPLGVIRAITWYPMTTGRSIDELLRLVLALQASDEHDASTPKTGIPVNPCSKPLQRRTPGLTRWRIKRVQLIGTTTPRSIKRILQRSSKNDPRSEKSEARDRVNSRRVITYANALRRAEELAESFKMLGNARRLKIVVFLDERERSVGEIEAALAIHQPRCLNSWANYAMRV